MSDLKHLEEWLKLPDAIKLNVYTGGRAYGLSDVVIESPVVYPVEFAVHLGVSGTITTGR